MKILNPTDIIRKLKKNKIAFVVFQTLYTKKIFSERGNYEYTAPNSGLKKSDLNLIMRVKNEVNKCDNIPRLTASDVHYIDKSDFLPAYIENIFEIDLNAAYWHFAYRNSFISEKLYKDGLNAPKKTRLISLGALAKKTTILKFDSEKFEPIQFAHSEKTQGAFFKVAQDTSHLMQSLKFICGNDYLFFWCDAIFLKNQTALNNCIELLESENFPFKIYSIDRFYSDSTRVNLISADYAQKHEKKNYCEQWNRDFIFEPQRRKPKNQIHKYYEAPKKETITQKRKKADEENNPPF